MKIYKEECGMTKKQVAETLKIVRKEVVLGAANLQSVTIKITSGTTGIITVRYLE